MRTDVTIDQRQVHCPNACTLGFGRYQARFGDFIQYKEWIDRARDAYQIRYAPKRSCYSAPVLAN